jgi:catechol 2,3-dioxygenase-like lactoylglutathione lyase family enzyme
VGGFDHVRITVGDLDSVTALFTGPGLEFEGRAFVEGEFIDTVIGIPDSRTEIVMLRPPDGGAGVELASFVRPDHEPGSPAMANELGLRGISFEVDDLQPAVDGLAANGYGLVGGIGQHENTWRMAQVRGPGGIVVSLTEDDEGVLAWPQVCWERACSLECWPCPDASPKAPSRRDRSDSPGISSYRGFRRCPREAHSAREPARAIAGGGELITGVTAAQGRA